MEFKFSKLGKRIVFRCLRGNKMAAQHTACILRNQQGKHTFAKENFKKISVQKKSKSVKSLRYMDEFFPNNDFSLLESYQLYIIAQYEARNCCKIEAAI